MPFARPDIAARFSNINDGNGISRESTQNTIPENVHYGSSATPEPISNIHPDYVDGPRQRGNSSILWGDDNVIDQSGGNNWDETRGNRNKKKQESLEAVGMKLKEVNSRYPGMVGAFLAIILMTVVMKVLK